MASRTWRFVAPVVVLATLGGCGGGDDDPEVGESLTSDSTTSTAPETGTSTEDTTTTVAELEGTVIEVKVVGGRPEGGVQRAAVKLGETAVLRVTSDVDDEVHVHGYDLTFDVGPGVAGEVTFEATIPGVFEVELHDARREILKLEVRP
jgi:hypothetical protein